MALREQFIVHDPTDVDAALLALEAAALVMFGAWMQRWASTLSGEVADDVGQIGVVCGKVGEARQQIQAGLAPNLVADSVVTMQRIWDVVARYQQDPAQVPDHQILQAVSILAGALTYLDERTQGTGSNHPRWNARLVSGSPCKGCGR